GSSVIATPALSTMYTVRTVRIDGCQDTSQIMVMVQPSPTIQISYTGCQSGTVEFTSEVDFASNNYQVDWYVNQVKVHTGSNYSISNPQDGMQVYGQLKAENLCGDSVSLNSAPVVLNCSGTSVPILN